MKITRALSLSLAVIPLTLVLDGCVITKSPHLANEIGRAHV